MTEGTEAFKTLFAHKNVVQFRQYAHIISSEIGFCIFLGTSAKSALTLTSISVKTASCARVARPIFVGAKLLEVQCQAVAREGSVCNDTASPIVTETVFLHHRAKSFCEGRRCFIEEHHGGTSFRRSNTEGRDELA